jgi:hypothetical protein
MLSSDFLLKCSRNIVAHCERLLATSTSEGERRRLKRIIADQMRFMAAVQEVLLQSRSLAA